ncbi:hypothetical protein IscW_ISCW021002 [Ixodes scapularis]|uniref:FHA domain-containing protein n=1 Tax=Ixodes scapularis TaxID=6945 RepID=B7Q954_IXOSC|nr:hypothetical protein IscW_ISCW021002 [Ixodes scapularis]|eukprot:XP_002405612.1 hypothetical protein IscW_ISCW021002 [Ixodes scapularis]
MALHKLWLVAHVLFVTSPVTQASWSRLLTDVIPGLRTTPETPPTAENKSNHLVYEQYNNAVEDLLDSILAAHNLPSESENRKRDKRSTSLDISIKDTLATYFDKYASVESRVVRDLEPFSIHNSDFLVVVNQRFSKDTAKVSTVVFKYDISRNAWKTLQEIPTYAATDAEFFTLGRYASTKEFFLAVANQYEQHDDHRNYAVDSIVYKYVDGKFVPFQCLHTTGATKIAAYDGSDGEFLLAVASLYEPVHLYQYNGWHFVLAQVQYTQSTMGPGVRDLSFYFTQPAKHILLDGPGVYKISFYHDNQIQRWYDESLKWCQESSALATENSAAQLASQLDNVFYTDQTEPIRIPGEVVFQDLHFEELATGESYSIKNLQELEKLQLELNAMMDIVRKTLDDLEDALKLTGDQVIAGDHHFESLGLECPSSGCQVSHLQTTYLNKEDVGNLAQRLFFTNMPQTVDTPMSFDHLNVENLSVDGAVNGMNVSKLVTVTGNHVLAGNIRFARPIHTKDLSVSGTLGGLVFSQKHLMLAEGRKTFKKIHLNGQSDVGRFIDGVNLSELGNYMRRRRTPVMNARQVVTGTKSFPGNLTLPPNSNVQTSNFSGVKLAELYSEAVLLTGDQVIAGKTVFEAPVTAPNFEFYSTLDGVSQDDIENWMLQGVDQMVNGDLVFEKNLETLAPLEVHDTINDVNLKDLAGRIAYKNESTTFTGPVRFAFLGSMADVHVTGTVQGIDVSEELVDGTKDVTLTGRKFLKNGFLVDGDIWVNGLLDSVKVDDLCKRAVRVNTKQVITAPTVVIGNIVFHRGVAVGGLLDGIDVKEMDTACLKTDGDAIVRGTKKFRNLIVEGPVTIRGLLNGMNLNFLKHNYMSVSKDQVVEARLRMPKMQVRDVTVRGTVNGVRMPEDVFTKIRPNVMTGPLEILGNVTVRNTLTMPESARLQGVDIDAWANDAVLNDGREYVVQGRKVFNSLNVADSLINGTLDGVHVSPSELLLATGEQVITGKKIFRNGMTVADLQVAGFLNGVNLHEFIRMAMLKSRNNTVTAPKRFVGGFRVATLHTLGRVGNVSLQELKLKTRSMENIEALVMHLQQEKNRIDELNLAFKQQAVFVSYYDKIFSFTVGQSRSACYAQLRDSTELFLLTLSGGTSTSCGVLKTFRVDHGSYNLFPAQHGIAVAHGSSIYHLVLPGADFIMVANKNSAMACSKQRPQMGVVGDELGHSSIEIFIWNSSIKALRLYQVVKIVDLQSLSLFHQKSQGCLAVVASGFLKIICLQDPSKGFRLLQNLPVHYSTGVSASHCPLDDSLLLAVSASQPGQFDRVFLYQWSQGLKKLASVPAVSVSSLAVVGHGGHCFVVVGQRRVGGADAATSVYRYLPGHPQAFLEVQRLLPGDVRSITWLPSPDNHTPLLFIHVGSNQGLKIYSFKGASGFVEQDSLHVDGSFNEVRTFRRSDGRHFVIMSSSHEEPSAVVLLSKIKGKPYNRP